MLTERKTSYLTCEAKGTSQPVPTLNQSRPDSKTKKAEKNSAHAETL